MTTLAITKSVSGRYAILSGMNVHDFPPDTVMQRVDAAMSWLTGQPSPHEVVLDDPSGIAVALVTAWILTNEYPCSVVFKSVSGLPVCQVGIWDNGHAYINAFNTEVRRAVQTTHPSASHRDEKPSPSAKQARRQV